MLHTLAQYAFLFYSENVSALFKINNREKGKVKREIRMQPACATLFSYSGIFCLLNIHIVPGQSDRIVPKKNSETRDLAFHVREQLSHYSQ